MKVMVDMVASMFIVTVALILRIMRMIVVMEVTTMTDDGGGNKNDF